MPYTKYGKGHIGRQYKGDQLNHGKLISGAPLTGVRRVTQGGGTPAPPPPVSKRKRVPTHSAEQLAASTDSPGLKAVFSSTAKRLAVRMAIALMFVDHLGGPPESLWDGPDGTIAIIRRNLYFYRCDHGKVKRVLEAVRACEKQMREYAGMRIVRRNPQDCHPNQLVTATDELKLIADCMESNTGLRNTTAFVNALRDSKAALANTVSEHVGMNAVYGTYRKMDAKVMRPEIAKQGSNVSHHTVPYPSRSRVLTLEIPFHSLSLPCGSPRGSSRIRSHSSWASGLAGISRTSRQRP